ncbi:hypothetical protein RRG08_018014 [Elysia crispata]|uniref:Uncharacterized protein n=1 Tax=Elysia crispata TaxID=231223 RepID=A0AAE1DF47_9GAST|nr:hypothetical protein RRG08_018014 [Elysia crispata]
MPRVLGRPFIDGKGHVAQDLSTRAVPRLNLSFLRLNLTSQHIPLQWDPKEAPRLKISALRLFVNHGTKIALKKP